MDYNKLYETNKKFKEYVDKCANARGIAPCRVMEFKITQEYAKECVSTGNSEQTIANQYSIKVGCDC